MLTYAHPDYALSLAEFGAPRRLEAAGGSVLFRSVPECGALDAMGCYPFFSCENWAALPQELETLENAELVCLGLVADPHGNYDPAWLESCFDRVRVFKEHYVVDLEGPLERIGSADRRKKARRALRGLEVEVCKDPAGFLDDWCALYEVLVGRHGIRGIRAFSREAFSRQLALPGVEVIKAAHAGETVGALLMFRQDDVVCGHLCALSEAGYRLRASYALDWFSFEHYTGRARLIDLGGGVALGPDGGLGDYKRGWATGTVPVRFCGRIFDRARYEEITKVKGIGPTDYFPAYRLGEYA